MEKIFWQWEWWKSLKKTLASCAGVAASNLTLALLVFSCFLLINVLAFGVFGGSINLGKYAVYFSSLKALRNSSANTLDEFRLNCTTWNRSNRTCSGGYPKSSPVGNPSPESTCPEYFRWIHEDLKHWKQTGVTKPMVEKAKEKAHFRLTILDGKVYVEKLRPSFQSRAQFTVWGIVQMMRLYPGKLPDLEIMFNSNDSPLIEEKDFRGPGADPPPLFRYCSSSRNLDIVFPDWSFWGWAEVNIKPWRSLLKDIKVGNERTKWEDRLPYAYWKGNPQVSPGRIDLMECNVTAQNDWNARLYAQDWGEEILKGFKNSNLGDQCTHRYKIYIEGRAWSVSDKYILACNSPALLMTLHWYDFFTRSLIPLRHYWPVRDTDKCRSLKFAVDWGNNHTEKAKSIGEEGSRFIHEDMKMEHVYDYMFHLLNEYAKLLKYKPTVPGGAIELSSETMARSENGIVRKFMDDTFEKSPRGSNPCKMPPAYEPKELKALGDEKSRATKKVEAGERLYWSKRNSKQ